MGKPEWGTKRTCHSCAERYYDLGRSPVVCPHCGATGQVVKIVPVRRPVAVAPKAPTAPVKAPVVVPAALSEGDSDDAEDDIEDVKADDDLIEDASDLGEDDDDIAEAMEHVVDEKVADGN